MSRSYISRGSETVDGLGAQSLLISGGGFLTHLPESLRSIDACHEADDLPAQFCYWANTFKAYLLHFYECFIS
jgi:hypothetical protein